MLTPAADEGDTIAQWMSMLEKDRCALQPVADTLVEQFGRIVARDGGQLFLMGVADNVIRVEYRPGGDIECADGACVLPGWELEQLMNETIARRAPELRVAVEVARPQ